MKPDYDLLSVTREGNPAGPAILCLSRQGGKTKACVEWWMENPIDRVLLCADFNRVKLVRRMIITVAGYMDSPVYHRHLADWLPRNVMTYDRWVNDNYNRMRNPMDIAVDDFDWLPFGSSVLIDNGGWHSIRLVTITND